MNKIKRILTIGLMALVMLTLVMAVTSCNIVNGLIGGHTHTEETVAGKAATCIESGLTEGKICSECKEVLVAQEEIPALGHSFTNYVSNNDATCEADGTKTAKCDRCTETDTVADVDSKLGHSFTNYVSNGDATCEADGTKTAKCDRCTETDTVADVDSKLGHSFTNYVSNSDSTCTEDGTKTAKCDRCTETDTVADVDSKLGHSFTNYASNNDATCEADGTKTAKCDRCTETDTVADVDSKLGHTPAEAVKENIVNASCNTDGSYDSVVYCSVEGCGQELSRETITVQATGDHNYATEQERKAATCEEDGYVIRACGCGETYKETISATGHSYESVVTAPTCTEDGYTTYTCACGYSYVADATEATGHTFDRSVATEDYLATPATCTASAIYYLSCSCGEKGSETFTSGDALGHTIVVDAAVAPTTTETGLTDGKHCSVCNTVTKAQTTVPAIVSENYKLSGQDSIGTASNVDGVTTYTPGTIYRNGSYYSSITIEDSTVTFIVDEGKEINATSSSAQQLRYLPAINGTEYAGKYFIVLTLTNNTASNMKYQGNLQGVSNKTWLTLDAGLSTIVYYEVDSTDTTNTPFLFKMYNYSEGTVVVSDIYVVPLDDVEETPDEEEDNSEYKYTDTYEIDDASSSDLGKFYCTSNCATYCSDVVVADGVITLTLNGKTTTSSAFPELRYVHSEDGGETAYSGAYQVVCTFTNKTSATIKHRGGSESGWTNLAAGASVTVTYDYNSTDYSYFKVRFRNDGATTGDIVISDIYFIPVTE